MITLHMLDMSDPTGFNVEAAQAAGIEGIAGYIGGFTPHVWTTEEWQRYVVEPGMRCVFLVFVPPQARAYYSAESGLAWADQALQAAQAAYDAGVPRTAALILDIEAPMVCAGSDSACQAWTTRLQSQNVPCGVYGPYDAFTGWPAVPEVAWVAQWPGGFANDQWPTVATPAQGLAPVAAWQFEGGRPLFGVIADRSVVTFTQTDQLPARIGVPKVEPTRLIPAANVQQALQNIRQTLSNVEKELGL